MCTFPPGKGLWCVPNRTLASRSVGGQSTPPSKTLEGQWVPPSAAFGSWTAGDINGLLGHSRAAMGFLALVAGSQRYLHLLLVELKPLLHFSQAQERSLGFAVQTKLRSGVS